VLIFVLVTEFITALATSSSIRFNFGYSSDTQSATNTDSITQSDPCPAYFFSFASVASSNLVAIPPLTHRVNDLTATLSADVLTKFEITLTNL